MLCLGADASSALSTSNVLGVHAVWSEAHRDSATARNRKSEDKRYEKMPGASAVVREDWCFEYGEIHFFADISRVVAILHRLLKVLQRSTEQKGQRIKGHSS
jgi:hypothetical protein